MLNSFFADLFAYALAANSFYVRGAVALQSLKCSHPIEILAIKVRPFQIGCCNRYQ